MPIYPFLALICSFLWALGYSILPLFNQSLNQYTINVTYGLTLVILNTIAAWLTNSIPNLFEIPNGSNWLLLVYSVNMAISSFISMMAYTSAGTSGTSNASSTVSAIASTYPLCQFLMGVMFPVMLKVNVGAISYAMVVPGILMIVGGVGMLSFAAG